MVSWFAAVSWLYSSRPCGPLVFLVEGQYGNSVHRLAPAFRPLLRVFVAAAGVFHSGNYGPPVGFCFDQACQDEPMMDDPLMADYNVERRASDFADACQVRTCFEV